MNYLNLLTDATFFYTVIRVTVPILLPSLGALITNKAGVPNIGLEGTMLSASFFGVVGSAYSGSAWVGLACAILTGVFMSLFLAYFTLKLKTNVILGGIALNLFSSALTVLLLYVLTGDKGTSASLPSKVLPNVQIPIIKDIPFIGQVLSNHNILVYITILILILFVILLRKTPLGHHIKAVGENENAAISVGIKVDRVRLISFIISGIVCGIAGAFLSMGYVSWFSRDMTASRGWIALAAEAMGRGTVLGTTLSSFLFGFASALANIFQLQGLPTELVSIIPNVMTVIALIIYSMIQRRRKQKV